MLELSYLIKIEPWSRDLSGVYELGGWNDDVSASHMSLELMSFLFQSRAIE